MRVLITGMRGAAGSYLDEYIRAENPEVEVFGFGRGDVDLRIQPQIHDAIADVEPDWIFHLASEAILPESFERPRWFFDNNVIGTVNLFEACRKLVPKARILMVSSCEVYGPPQQTPMTEDHPFNPMSPYAVSKAAQDQMARMYAKVYGMHVVTSRLFNYINPRRADLFSSAFARQVALIEAGKQKELVHGNLDSARTLLDVHDVVRGYWDLLEHGEPGEAYNIGSPTEIEIGAFLDILISKAKIQIPTRQDNSLIRPVDISTQVADQSKFVKATGWAPRYTLEESIDWLLQTWRENVARG